MRRSRLIIAILIVMGTLAAESSVPNQLVGTWRLVSVVAHDAAGRSQPSPSLGANPAGFIVYDTSGYVFVQLMAGNRLEAPCAVTSPATPNNVTHVGGYDAYFGRYEVDAVAGTVTHRLEGAIAQSDVGRAIKRSFRIEGDTLALWFSPSGTADSKDTREVMLRRVTS